MRLLLLFVLLATSSSCDAMESDESAEKKEDSNDGEQKKVVDRLAVNMANAFVSSLFPEVTKAKQKIEEKKTAVQAPQPSEDVSTFPGTEIRRAPQMRSGMDMQQQYDSPIPQYSAQNVASSYNAMAQSADANPMYPMRRDGSAAARPLYAASPSLQEVTGLSAANSAPLIDAFMPSAAAMMAGQPSAPAKVDAINAVRNQQYLAKLAQHQSELNQYSQKQLEYLDQQRRYQQAMIDHQAGAALLMQQQQQQLIEQQMEKARQMENQVFDAHQPTTSVDNTGAKGVLVDEPDSAEIRRSAAPRRRATEDDLVVTDESLKKYFKAQYGIDIPEDGNQLTEDERETLRLLKRELERKKELAIEQGSFRTMDQLKPQVLQQKRDEEVFRSETRNGEEPPLSSTKRCPKCLSVSLKEISGTWTQIYGNPSAMKRTFSTIMSLERMDLSEQSKTVSMSKRKPVCVGMEISKAKKGAESTALNVFFRDDGQRKHLHEMTGEMYVQRDDTFLLSTEMYNTQVCIVKAGPSEANRFEYFAMIDSSHQSCSAVHVFARSVDEFHRRHFDDIADFLQTKIRPGGISPVAQLPEPELCELN